MGGKIMTLIDHAKRELDLIVKQCEDEEAAKMQEAINKDIMNIVEMFGNQGHSGFSASYAIKIITKLLNYDFITPLTGEDDEWMEVTDGVYQNKRQGRIFKQADRFDGKPYYIDGKAFSDDGGKSWYTNGDSFVTVEFPLRKLPETEYIILEGEENEQDN